MNIGFIGASGLMGHGMAKNLLAKGHTLAVTVHKKRDPLADLLAGGAAVADDAAALAARALAALYTPRSAVTCSGGWPNCWMWCSTLGINCAFSSGLPARTA